MKTKRVNILVAKAFIPNPYLYPIVNHIDLDKENNNKKNLEWTTASENMKHAYRNGVKHSMIGRFGSDHVRSKAVIKKDLLNNPISTYGSIVEAAMDVGVSPNNISNTCNGKRLTSAGYKWEFSSNSET